MALLNTVTQLVHDPVRSKYPYESLTKELSDIINIRQIDKENFTNYVKSFKEQRDILKLQLGSNILDTFV